MVHKHHAPRDPHYKWVALSNTTLGMLAASINGSILLISLPAIFRGIGLKPLEPSNVNILLWSIMGYMVATSVLVVTFGRLGDSLGRARIYNLGFLIFTVCAVALSLIPGSGPFAAWYLIAVRVVQGVGGAMLMANSTAILTDAFPKDQRGLALGINTVAAIGGSFIGLLIGGLLADINWQLVFWINVPFGVIGTAWAYWKLKDRTAPKHRPVDWIGNFTFGIGLILILIGITEGIQPYGAHAMAWTSPEVLGLLIVGLALILVFLFVEQRVAFPMFDLKLFRIRPFSLGNLASLGASIGRGGLQFMLIIWLQGIWLPLHGYSFEETPLWAGIFMLPLTLGFLVATPVSGYLSDHHGARPFAVGGMLLGAASFAALMTLPPDFSYPLFALLLFVNGLGSGLFVAPNSTAIMNSVPAAERGQAAGMRATTLNAGQVLSIGIFFSLMIVGLTEQLPAAMEAALVQQSVPEAIAHHAASAPAVASLFAAFLGYNPMGELLSPDVLASLPAANAAEITGKTFFPHLMAGPFMHGLVFAFTFSMTLNLLAAAASWGAGGKFVHAEAEPSKEAVPAAE
ncbi:MFS transporter [Kaistia dalseonensis]|uniref:MFS family permease n=1 Tax=Kaistia dalseonensis TaxID=410840 RepID=A0ABU0H825_9HYPH|nr:MFS transporter [Kaistia dalseonensis]MCX5495072.1 MFS transporter [Kaistia dalseonensis]MDQ0437654.1 MFS family permease [Kaistia dalseonensis]